MRALKFLAAAAVMVLLLGVGVSRAWADGPVTTDPQDQSPLMRNGLDPNYVFTPQELKAIALKQAQAKQYVEQMHAARPNQIQPYTAGYHAVYIGTYLEPNDYAHRNYCGPAATQVILSTRLPANQIPNIDQVGTDENIDPSWGVYNTAIRDELNRLLSTTWYIYSVGNSQSTVWSDIVFDIDRNWSLDTSLYTGGMPGWGTRDVRHIVAIYGYYETSPGAGYVYYIETGQSAQGYSGSYGNVTGLSTFYGYISAHSGNNNTQVW